MLLIDGRGSPLGVDVDSARPAEARLICPHRKNRTMRPPRQDGRDLRRDRERGKVERAIA